MFDHKRSEAIATAQVCIPKYCFYNALKALRNRSLALPLSTKYVEGTIKVYGVDIAHGWLELEDGTILDPTFIVDCIELETLYNVKAHEPFEYYPLFRYSRDDLKGVRLNQVPLKVG